MSFHEAAGARELLDDPGGTWVGHVHPQRGLQIDADGRQFGLKKGAHRALVANHQAPNALGNSQGVSRSSPEAGVTVQAVITPSKVIIR